MAVSIARFHRAGVHAFEQAGENPNRLKLALIETMFVNGVCEVISKMSHLHDKDVRFSLDDCALDSQR